MPKIGMVSWLQLLPRSVEVTVFQEWIEYKDIPYLRMVLGNTDLMEIISVCKRFVDEIRKRDYIEFAEAVWLQRWFKCSPRAKITVVGNNPPDIGFFNKITWNMVCNSDFTSTMTAILRVSNNLDSVEILCNGYVDISALVDIFISKNGKCSIHFSGESKFEIKFDHIFCSLFIRNLPVSYVSQICNSIEQLNSIRLIEVDLDIGFISHTLQKHARSLRELHMPDIVLTFRWLEGLSSITALSCDGFLFDNEAIQDFQLRNLKNVDIQSCWAVSDGELEIGRFSYMTLLGVLLSNQLPLHSLRIYEGSPFANSLLSLCAHSLLHVDFMWHRTLSASYLRAFFKQYKQLKSLHMRDGVAVGFDRLDVITWIAASDCAATLTSIACYRLYVNNYDEGRVAAVLKLKSLQEFKINTKVGSKLVENLHALPNLRRVLMYPLLQEQEDGSVVLDLDKFLNYDLPVHFLPHTWWTCVKVGPRHETDKGKVQRFLELRDTPFAVRVAYELLKWLYIPLNISQIYIDDEPTFPQYRLMFGNWPLLDVIVTPEREVYRKQGYVKIHGSGRYDTIDILTTLLESSMSISSMELAVLDRHILSSVLTSEKLQLAKQQLREFHVIFWMKR